MKPTVRELGFNLAFQDNGTVLLSIAQASALLGKSPEALKYDRKHKQNIPFKRMGTSSNSTIKYAIHDVIAYIFRYHPVGTTLDEI